MNARAIASEHSRRFVQFVVIGGGVFVFGVVALAFMVEQLHIPETTAYATQLVASVLINFYLSKYITWRDRRRRRSELLQFMASRIASAALAWLIYSMSIRYGVHYQIANVISVAVTTLVNYVVADKWVFVRHELVRIVPSADELRLTWRDGLKFLLGNAFVVLLIWILQPALLVPIILAVVAVLSFLLALMSLIGVLYAYKDPEQPERLRLPKPDGISSSSIAVLMPARHEVAVLPYTMLTAAWTQRDHAKYGIYAVVCDDDVDTTHVARIAAQVINWGMSQPGMTEASLRRRLQEELSGMSREALPEVEGVVQVLVYPLRGQKPSKPKQLNFALEQLHESYSVFTILDAESVARPGLLTHVDKALRDHPECDIIQCGVQLMPPEYPGNWFKRHLGPVWGWYRWHNLLEYYRWFSGQMRFQSDNGYMPLGGNTVFIRTPLLRLTNGWPDELTEDCALGTLAAAMHGSKTMTFYDPALTTLEETPGTLNSFLKQRVRWNQGFLQTFIGGKWRALPASWRRMLALWVLSISFFQALSAVIVPITIVTMIAVKSPPLLVLMMYTPIIAMVLALCLQVLQLYEFGRVYRYKIPMHIYLLVVATNPLYQLLLSFAAARAVVRHMRGDTSWSKTQHSGNHLDFGAVVPVIAQEGSA